MNHKLETLNPNPQSQPLNPIPTNTGSKSLHHKS